MLRAELRSRPIFGGSGSGSGSWRIALRCQTNNFEKNKNWWLWKYHYLKKKFGGYEDIIIYKKSSLLKYFYRRLSGAEVEIV